MIPKPDISSSGAECIRPRRRSRESPATSPGPRYDAPSEDVLLAVGILVSTHGVHGELSLKPVTDFPEHLGNVERVFIGDEAIPYDLVNVRFVRKLVLISLEDVETKSAAELLLGEEVRISGTDAVPLSENEFFYYQIIGLSVIGESGEQLGKVVDIIETGSNAVLSVEPEDGTNPMLVPYLPNVILDVDTSQGTMVIRPLEYLDE